jgi:anti-sigma regulatory factor (Ser/Thr protein kinase)
LHDDPAALAVLRHQLRCYLAESHAPSAVVADVVLATQEAAKNALWASLGQPVAVRVWTTDGTVWVCVQDRGQGFAQRHLRRCPSVWSTHGRGLCLMNALMDEVTIEQRHGTRVLMCRRLDHASVPPKSRAATVARLA